MLAKFITQYAGVQIRLVAEDGTQVTALDFYVVVNLCRQFETLQILLQPLSYRHVLVAIAYECEVVVVVIVHLISSFERDTLL